MMRIDTAVLELTHNWRSMHLSVVVDDMPEDIMTLRRQLRDVFDEAETMEVKHIVGTRLWKGKMWEMKPSDRARLRALRKPPKIFHNSAK